MEKAAKPKRVYVTSPLTRRALRFPDYGWAAAFADTLRSGRVVAHPGEYGGYAVTCTAGDRKIATNRLSRAIFGKRVGE